MPASKKTATRPLDKHPFRVYLGTSDRDWLKAEVERTGESASSIVRSLIRCQQLANAALEQIRSTE